MVSSRDKIQRGSIMPDFIYTRIKWDNKTVPYVLGALISVENKRLYFIKNGRKNGEFSWIPTDGEWFDYEYETLADDLCISPSQIRKIRNELIECGLISKRIVYKPKAQTKNGLKKVNKDIYTINWDFMVKLEEAFDKESHPKITLEEMKELAGKENRKAAVVSKMKTKPKEKVNVNQNTEDIDAWFSAPDKVQASEPEPVVRTLENHPEEDEELIEIISNICCGKGKEEASTILEQYISGHRESEELINHYFQLWYEQVGEEEQPETDYRKRLFEHLEWYRRKNRPLGFEVMYEALDDTTVVQDIYSYDEVKNLFNEYKDMVQVA